MVAYSFKAMFAPAILAGTKKQTIRAERKRHARPGEALQLYVGMRTRQCRKIIEPDPVCKSVDAVLILMTEFEIAGICINNVWLNRDNSMEVFARADGFLSLRDMHAFWLQEHGARNFNGVLITWT